MAERGGRGHPAAIDATRHYTLEETQIGRDIDREAVQRHPSPQANADRGDLFIAHPDTGQPLPSARRDTAACQRVDQDLFQLAQILNDVAIRAFEFENWIADQLTGAVISYLPAARDSISRNVRRRVDQEALLR